MSSLLEQFGLSPVVGKEVMQAVLGDSEKDLSSVSPADALTKWVSLLPAEINQQISLALNQERPFMPPDITPEWMAEPNATVPAINNIEIIYRGVDFAMKAEDFRLAAALVYVVDRACYRFGRSAALLLVVDELMQLSPDTAIAPQVILRKARVMKDSGDMHGAMRILDAVISRKMTWNYQDQAQYENTKAVCVQIKGQILHNLGLWKDAVTPLVESVHSFIFVNDQKGLSSSFGLLCRCLNKLSKQDYAELCGSNPGVFVEDHPCYEAYKKGLEAVRQIEDLGATLYVAKHQLVADESLLMFTIQQHAATKERKWFQIIVKEMKQSLAGHRTVHSLHSVEAFFEFVRAVFMISLTLTFSPVRQDADLARFLEKLSMELYHFMCVRPLVEGGSDASGTLTQNKYSVRLMNGALALLGLPPLQGSTDMEQVEEDHSWDDSKTQSEVSSGSGDTFSSSSALSSSSNSTPIFSSGDGSSNSSQSSVPISSGADGSPNHPQSSTRNVSSFGQSDALSHDQSNLPSQSQPSGDRQLSFSSSKLQVHKAGVCLPSTIPHKLQGGGSSASVVAPVASGISDEAATFPVMSSSKFKAQRISNSVSPGGKVSHKFVGLPVGKDELLSATCPAVLSYFEDAVDGDWEVVRSGDLELILPSAQAIASIAAVENSGGVISFSSADLRSMAFKSAASGTVDLSATTKSTSSATEWTNTSEKDTSDSSNKGNNVDSSGKDNSTSSSNREDKSANSSGSSFAVISPGSSSSSNEGSNLASSNPQGSGNSGTVDLSATTKSTSSGTSESVDLAEDGSSPLDAESSPLVDLSSEDVCSLLAGLRLGGSVETSDSEEFLASWTPSDDKSVHRAVLWMYNPVSGQWSAQTTLAHMGPKLHIDKEGKFRDAFHVSFLHQDEPLGRYVGKRYRRQRKPDVYMQDVVCQMLAGFYVTRFCQALQHCTLDILQVQFLSAAHLQLCDASGEVTDWINVEPFLHGSFLKLTNNLQFVSRDQKDERGVEVVTALSHFSYVETGGTLMVVDLQGWMPSDGKGIVYLTDPVFHTRYIKKFSSCDHQEEGMKAFWKKQHPTCNRICQFLGLDKSRP